MKNFLFLQESTSKIERHVKGDGCIDVKCCEEGREDSWREEKSLQKNNGSYVK